MKPETIDLSVWQLAFAASLLLVSAGISLWMQLGLESRIIWAGVRTVVQLTAAGFILKTVFSLQQPLAVAVLIGIMTLIAGHAAAQRSRRRYRGIVFDSAIAMLLSSWTMGLFLLVIVVHPEPWWAPRYSIPLIGMILGNSLNGISLGLDRLTDAFVRDRWIVEMRLAIGATRWEAARPVVQDAVRTGMTPTINSMVVIGLVSLPGMMTGQILAGADPVVAVKYQIVIMFVIAAAVAVGTIGVCSFAYRRVINKCHQFDPSTLT